jgi:hypothetical protein
MFLLELQMQLQPHLVAKLVIMPLEQGAEPADLDLSNFSQLNGDVKLALQTALLALSLDLPYVILAIQVAILFQPQSFAVLVMLHAILALLMDLPQIAALVL